MLAFQTPFFCFPENLPQRPPRDKAVPGGGQDTGWTAGTRTRPPPKEERNVRLYE